MAATSTNDLAAHTTGSLRTASPCIASTPSKILAGRSIVPEYAVPKFWFRHQGGKRFRPRDRHERDGMLVAGDRCAPVLNPRNQAHHPAVDHAAAADASARARPLAARY